MTWNVVGASVAGTSQSLGDKGCDDDCWVSVELWDGRPSLVMVVSDGAGSALHGAIGAQTAVRTAVQFFDCLFSTGKRHLEEILASECLSAIRFAIAGLAEATGTTPRDYASTLLVLVSCGSETLAFQVGDGGLVVKTAQGLNLLFTPSSGEYANMTNFVTDANAESSLMIRFLEAEIQCAAAFSDGLQRVALDIQNDSPHAPFFEPLFAVVGRGQATGEKLQSALINFLNSPAMNDRTDDDKTLVIAVKQLG